MNALHFKRFNDLVESCGNRYLAVRLVAQWARGFESQYPDSALMESKLIDWVVTGKCPYSNWELATRHRLDDDDELEELLCGVMDEDIVSEVRKMYKLSVRAGKLLLSTNKQLSVGELTRTNVLLRMVWYTNA